MTVEHSQPVLFGEEPEVPETIEQARARAARAGLERLTTVDSDSGLNPIQEDLGWREGSGTAYDNRPLLDDDSTKTESTPKTNKISRKSADSPPSGRDQERFIVQAQGVPTERDAEVAHRHSPQVRRLAAPALRETIAIRAGGDVSLERALLRARGLKPLDTQQ